MFCLDFNDTSRLEELQEVIALSKAKRVLIDHHLNPTIDGIVTISHPEASSTWPVWRQNAAKSSGAPASVASTVKTSPQTKAAKAFFALKIGSGHFSPVTSR